MSSEKQRPRRLAQLPRHLSLGEPRVTAELLERLEARQDQEPCQGGAVRETVAQFHYADPSEIYEAGTAHYAPPGHIPIVSAGTEIVEFSPTGEYTKTMEVVAGNLAAMQTGLGRPPAGLR